MASPRTPEETQRYQYRQIKMSQVKHLGEMSWNILRHNLVDRYELSLSSTHELILRHMLRDFALLTVGNKIGRIAWPLSPGAGKSESILAFITALDKLKLTDPETKKPYPIMVTSSRVSALCELLDSLQKQSGIKEIGESWESLTEKGTGSFGLLYSAPNKDATRLPSPNAEDAQYLFTTHARVRRERDESVEPRFDIRTLAEWNGAPRMVFYDESLLTSDHWSIPKVNLFAALKSFDEYVVGHNNHDGLQQLRLDAVACLRDECFPLLRQELEEQVQQKREPRLVYLPERDYKRYREALKPLRRVPDAIFDLLDIAHKPLRVVAENMSMTEGAFISFQIAIPSELDRVVVLDASYLVRSLCLADASMTLGDHPSIRYPLKTYENVQGYVIHCAGGRRGIERSVTTDQKMLYEIVEIVKSLPPDEKVLIFTFKDRPSANRYHQVKIRQQFEAVLKDAGIDVKSRITFLTWGQETASNHYRDIPNVILAGVLHRSNWDLMGAFLGQKADLLLKLTPQEIEDLSITESTHHAYQAIHRGPCRKMRAGKALPMRFWVFYEHGKKLMQQLSRVMPGVQWPQYKNRVLPTFEEKQQITSEKIAAHLNALPHDVHEVSCRAIRAELKLMQIKRMTFFRAVNRALQSVPTWERHGQSLIRTVRKGEPSPQCLTMHVNEPSTTSGSPVV